MNNGKLILIPTPISTYDLHHETKALLLDEISKKSLMVIEEPKACRRRWLSWGLPRESIEGFETYNEHNRDQQIEAFIKILKSGVNICMMSDCGLPAFCDPGRRLVTKCHKSNIEVSSAAFDNSVLLALALSGFEHESFWFAGFLPRKTEDKKALISTIAQRQETTIIMDTPYRLNKTIEDLKADPVSGQWSYFFACDLSSEKQLLAYGSIKDVSKKLGQEKREFVAVISPKYGKKS